MLLINKFLKMKQKKLEGASSWLMLLCVLVIITSSRLKAEVVPIWNDDSTEKVIDVGTYESFNSVLFLERDTSLMDNVDSESNSLFNLELTTGDPEIRCKDIVKEICGGEDGVNVDSFNVTITQGENVTITYFLWDISFYADPGAWIHNAFANPDEYLVEPGDFFPIGNTRVIAFARNSFGTSTCSFFVRVSVNSLGNENDADCDGVSTDIDCDDNDASVMTTNENDADCDGVVTEDDCDDNDASITTSNKEDSDGDGVNDCDDICEGSNDMMDTDNDGIPDGCDDCEDVDEDGVCAVDDCDDNDASVGSNANDMDCDGVPTDEDCDDNDPDVTTTETPECTIIGTDNVNLENGNTVIGDVCLMPNADVIPTFYFNTVSTGDSPDVTVNDGETLVLNGQVFEKIEVKEGGTLTFTESNIFINELKTEKHTTIKFADCANVFINKKLELQEYSNFNPEMNNVTLFVDDNVLIKKGSSVSAHIYANTHEIKAEGDKNYPIYMKGMFVAKKVEGKKYVTWEGSAYCSPCPIEIPEPTVTCECNGGLVEVTFYYDGALSDLSTNSGTIADNTGGIFTVSNNGVNLEKNLEISTGGNTAEIHTSCSQDILGVTFPGGINVIGYIDSEGNVSSVDGCEQAVVCDCDGKIVEMTVVYGGSGVVNITVGDDENGNNPIQSFDDVKNGDVLIADKVGDIGNWWYWSVNGTVDASIHTSCSDDILGNVDADKSDFGDFGAYPDPADGDNGTFLVVSHTDDKGNVCSIPIPDNTAGRSGNTSAKGSDVVSKDEFNKENPKVDINVKSWPNPTRDNFNIRITSNNLKELVKVQVLNIMGQTVISDSFNTNQDYKFGNKLESGLYFVKVSQGENLQTLKLMKY